MTAAPGTSILDLKNEAKNLRDLGLEGYEEAAETIREAIEQAQSVFDGTTVAEIKAQMAKELADCQGILGGIERRWGLESPDATPRAAHLAASCHAYDAGFRFEWDERYNIRKSYNLVNRLTGRLLLKPDLLRTESEVDVGHGLGAIHMLDALADAKTRLAKNLTNKGDLWAEADAALLDVLIERTPPSTAYAQFLSLSALPYVFTSVLDGLRPLAALNELDVQPLLRAAVTLLEERSPHPASG